jgi:hypothetical protein
VSLTITVNKIIVGTPAAADTVAGEMVVLVVVTTYK